MKKVLFKSRLLLLLLKSIFRKNDMEAKKLQNLKSTIMEVIYVLINYQISFNL